MSNPEADDNAIMGMALSLARRGLGNVWPNPAVGCVMVRPDQGGLVVGRGWTQPGGRPHAETEALARAGEASRGATAYVALEPCDHHGETPPCSLALIDAGVGRVVVATSDPDPRVAGQGIARLKDAGIDVSTEVRAEEAKALNQGFLLRVGEGRPQFTVKTATTLDGRIATRDGESQWITGHTARQFAHRLRAEHDAVMIGSSTALADDPMLTCRLPGMTDRSPIRIVADTRLRLPLTSRLVATAKDVPLWLVTLDTIDPARLNPYIDAGVEIVAVADDGEGRPDLRQTARELATRGLTRVLIEGGGRLTAAFLSRGLVDRLVWFRAPSLIGGDGMTAAAAFGIDALSDAPRFLLDERRQLEGDVVETYDRAD